ncbi:MAG: TolC family outer membrane protein, partial [Sulfurimonadaceae bacterium]|nr:TolC family outer membrane protein [Sulfurimonadaceae bacterium]
MRIPLVSALLIASLPLSALTLEEVVRETLRTNPDMQKYVSDYKAMTYDLEKARAGYRPTVDISGNIGPEHTETETTESDLTRKELGIVAKENLFAGFHTENDIKEQEARVESARGSALQRANVLALEIVEAYMEVLKQKALLGLEKENVKTHERIYAMIREKTEQGIGRRSDMEQTDGRLALAYSNYISQLNNYQDRLINLERLYGRAIDGSTLETPQAPNFPGNTQDALRALALQFHPTLLIEAANVMTREAQFEKEKSAFYPTLDAELSADMRDDVTGIEGQTDAYRALLRLEYNLYNGGSDEASRLQNLEHITSQKHSQNEQMRAVKEKLDLSWTTYQLMSRQLPCSRLYAQLSKTTSASYAEEYQLGRRSLLDLLNVELEYSDARNNVIAAEHDLLLSRFRILENLGLLNYALETGIEQAVEAPLPEKIALEIAKPEEDRRPIYTDNDGLNIYEMCSASRTELKFALIEPEEITTASGTVETLVTKASESEEAFVMENIFFNFNSTDLTDETAAYLQLIAKELKKHPDYHVSIYAHTDSFGSLAYTQELSQRRAQRVL